MSFKEYIEDKIEEYKKNDSSVEELVRDLKDIWYDKEITKRKIIYQTGKAGVVNQWKWIVEELGRKKLSKKEIQEYSDTLLEGMYTMDGLNPKGPVIWNDEHDDGRFVKYSWDREEKGVKKGEIWSIQNWEDGYGTVEKYITKEEFEELSKGKQEIKEI